MQGQLGDILIRFLAFRGRKSLSILSGKILSRDGGKKMDEVIQFLTEYGAIVLFTVILLEQLGLPLPSQLFLIAAGGKLLGPTLTGYAEE